MEREKNKQMRETSFVRMQLVRFLETWSTYPIVNNTFKRMFQLFLKTIRLENINNTNKQQQTLAAMASSGNATRTKMENYTQFGLGYFFHIFLKVF